MGSLRSGWSLEVELLCDILLRLLGFERLKGDVADIPSFPPCFHFPLRRTAEGAAYRKNQTRLSLPVHLDSFISCCRCLYHKRILQMSNSCSTVHTRRMQQRKRAPLDHPRVKMHDSRKKADSMRKSSQSINHPTEPPNGKRKGKEGKKKNEHSKRPTARKTD